MKQIAKVVFLALFFLVSTPQGEARGPTGVAARRWGWFYNNGAVRKVSLEKWQEKSRDREYTYREVKRTDTYVELFDENREYTVRLYNSSMYAWSERWNKWRLVRAGRWDDPNKEPIDTFRNAEERTQLETTSERSSFPHLGRDFEVLRPGTKTYNCIAWSLGVTDRWLWPVPSGQPVHVRDFDNLFARHGYRRLSSLNFERVEGQDKLILYTRRKDDGTFEPTHTARQLSDGSWSSKLGKLPLIRHLHPGDVSGDTYGEPTVVYVRGRPAR
jgi:hypothetical protein